MSEAGGRQWPAPLPTASPYTVTPSYLLY